MKVRRRKKILNVSRGISYRWTRWSFKTIYCPDRTRLDNYISEYADYVKRLAKAKTLSHEERIKLSFDKVRLNGHSGAHAPVSMPLFNKITHSSLTPDCRAANGYSEEQSINPSKE